MARPVAREPGGRLRPRDGHARDRGRSRPRRPLGDRPSRARPDPSPFSVERRHMSEPKGVHSTALMCQGAERARVAGRLLRTLRSEPFEAREKILVLGRRIPRIYGVLNLLQPGALHAYDMLEEAILKLEG